MTDILYDPAIHVRTPQGHAVATLPEVMALLALDQIEDFTHLRDFQEHSWHAFLAQLGALALISHGAVHPPAEPGHWRLMLQALTHEAHPDGEPWTLAVHDQAKPAFMQPPTMNGSFTAKSKTLPTPDAIDIPIGSRRHDVKNGVAVNPEADHWIYALISLQTCQGFSGNSLYPISRMNGGFGNRHSFSITPSIRWGPHVCRDMTILTRRHSGNRHLGHLLLWTRPWTSDKDETISLDTLQPAELYIEVCRRIRLFPDPQGRLRAAQGTSKSPRIDATDRYGNTGDPWTLTQKDKAVTVSSRGFTPRTTTGYLDPASTTLPPLAHHHAQTDGDQPMYLVARALCRGQGRTGGYHTVTIPISNAIATMLDSGERQERLAKAAQERLAVIAETQRILSAALRTYTDMPADNVYSWTGQLDNEPTTRFWAALSAEIESNDPQAQRARWTHQDVIPAAAAILRQAHRALGANAHTRHTAQANSEDLFRGMIRTSTKLPPAPQADQAHDGQNAHNGQEEQC